MPGAHVCCTFKPSHSAPEKHIPTVSSAGSQLTMTVAHVMDPEKPHFIEYMWLKDATSDAGKPSQLAW